MPGYIGNYSLPLPNRSDPNRFNTLACKLVTGFTKNDKLPEPLPNILATICLFDTLNGRLKCVLEATEITAWRTAAASLVATQHLYFGRPNVQKGDTFNLAIVGCGVQVGRKIPRSYQLFRNDRSRGEFMQSVCAQCSMWPA